MLLKKDDTKFDKINSFLTKKGHQMLISIYLSNYSERNIYIRLDYIKKASLYKIVWFDMDLFDEKKIDYYLSQQVVDKVMALSIVRAMASLTVTPGFKINEDIMGDRVEILSYINGDDKEFIFDRFLPLEWEELIEPLAIVFSYLPKAMEIYISEMFASFDGKENFYNIRKPIRFDLEKGNLNKLFSDQVITRAKKYADGDRVSFLEKIDNVYIAIVDGFKPELVAIEELKDGFIVIKSNCKCGDFCKHICSVIIAIREKKFNNFYKVRYVGANDKSLLDKITNATFNLCFGIDGEKLLLITAGLEIYNIGFLRDGKAIFEIIEDDDECNLSKSIDKLIKK